MEISRWEITGRSIIFAILAKTAVAGWEVVRVEKKSNLSRKPGKSKQEGEIL